MAERAGVTRGAVNHHFRSKTILLSEALQWGWSEYGDRLFARVDEATDPSEWLHGLLTESVALLRSDRRFRALASTTVLVAPQAHSTDPSKNDVLDAWRDDIAAALTGVRAPISPETIAGLVLVLLQGFTVTAVTRPHDLPQPDELDAAIAAWVRGLLT